MLSRTITTGNNNMDYCNFGKVIIARDTKDFSTIKYWNANKENEGMNHLYTNSLTYADRHFNYLTFLSKDKKCILILKHLEQSCQNNNHFYMNPNITSTTTSKKKFLVISA